MGNMVTVPVVEVTIRRDAHTITRTQVKPYELTLLRQTFGRENVHDEKQVGAQEVDSTAEFERMCAKYGPQKVVKVYGDDGGERLQELVERAAVKATGGRRKASVEDIDGPAAE